MKVYNDSYCSACYFRTIADYPNKKCLIQLTERCNLHCEHCFVSSNCSGQDMKLDEIKKHIIPNFILHKVKKVTLTGGEPFVYPHLYDVIKLLCDNKISVCICTNASLITRQFLNKIYKMGDVHFNVSLDGFSNKSHGKFRGNEDIKLYDKIIENIKLLGEYTLLNGILVTPNQYADISEYVEICKFAKKCGAQYVLMNPLSEFGRGEDSIEKLSYSTYQMNILRESLKFLDNDELELVYIRFPNIDRKPLSSCNAGELLYIFTNGDIAYCPYMAFAAKDKASKYRYNDFIMGNIFNEKFDWDIDVNRYKFPVEESSVCSNCKNIDCKKGCFAAKISRGKLLEDCDEELCPKRINEV